MRPHLQVSESSDSINTGKAHSIQLLKTHQIGAWIYDAHVTESESESSSSGTIPSSGSAIHAQDDLLNRRVMEVVGSDIARAGCSTDARRDLVKGAQQARVDMEQRAQRIDQ